MIRLEDFVPGGPLVLRSLETIDVAGGDIRGRFNSSGDSFIFYIWGI